MKPSPVNSKKSVNIERSTLDINVTQHPPFLRGKLTLLSAALMAFLEGPNVAEKAIEWINVFSKAADSPPSMLTLVAFLGMVWGIYRRRKGYFEKNSFDPGTRTPDFIDPERNV